ncbi:TetR family transcriptional regulator [Nocardiopsis sp. HNM0947]|uniref:TetR family transcriptional regulator n=1 Tax=Nocardiopsis coralli TaxID=2772213 RepID=A0ABR9P2E2_9ACTN|nr:TetR family transcriptional regulator [Nocardiopsis coralli]
MAVAQARVSTREVVLAAVGLFTEYGFERTTMDGIAAATGVSRRSLFRRFGSKEDILFAEHDELFATVVGYLDASPDDPLTAVRSAARMVFQGYVRDPEITLPRYRLVRAHPRLRDREVAMTARYQSAFSHYLTERAGSAFSLASGVVAASVIAAHNHVLRSWLRGSGEDEETVWVRFDEAMAYVSTAARPLLDPQGGPEPDRVLVAVYPSGAGNDEVLRRIGAALEPGGS